MKRKKRKVTTQDLIRSRRVGGAGSSGVPPVGLIYSNDEQSIRLGESLVPMVPSLSEGNYPITYSITAGALPAGVVIDPDSGIIYGTPTEAGSWSVTVTATNSYGSTTAPGSGNVTASVNNLGIGVNPLWYSAPSQPFRDVMKQSFSWQARDGATGTVFLRHDLVGGVTVPTIAWGSTGEGYPDWTALKAINSNYIAIKRLASGLGDSFYTGLHTVYWDGYQSSNAVKLRGSVVAVDSGPGWGSYLCNDGTGNLTIQVEDNDVLNPVRNIRVMGPNPNDPQNQSFPDPGPGDPIYHPKFISRLVQWTPEGQDPTVRLMQWMGLEFNAINAPGDPNSNINRWWVHTWADRPKQTDSSQFETTRYHDHADVLLSRAGFCVEDIVALMQELTAASPTGKCNVWLNLPHQEEDPDDPGSMDYADFIVGYATAIFAGQPLGCTVLWEYTNEIWNSGYRPYNWVRANIGTQYVPSDPEFQDFVAAKMKECMDHVLSVYSGAGKPYEIVWMGHIAENTNPQTNGYTQGVLTALNVLEANYVQNNIAAIGCAFYVSSTAFNQANPPADEIELINHLINDRLPVVITALKAKRVRADAWGLKLYGYEGGAAMYPNFSWQQIARRAHYHPLMYTLYDQLGDALADPLILMDLIVHFALAQRWELITDASLSGHWCLVNDLYDEPGDPPDYGSQPKLTSWLEWPKIL